VAAGTPEQIVKVKKSHTGRFLKPLLESQPVAAKATKKAAVKKRE
jgi:excinuclease ABC subunit A